MLSTALTTALALLFVSGACAAPAPASSTPTPAAASAANSVIDLSALKTSYYWNVTDISSSFVPSGVYRSLDFTVAFNAQPNTTHCHSGYGSQPGANGGGRYDPCDNPVVMFTSDLSVDVVNISQQFVYKGANVLVNGSAPLSLYGGSACQYGASGGGTCSQKQVTVKVSSAALVTKKN